MILDLKPKSDYSLKWTWLNGFGWRAANDLFRICCPHGQIELIRNLADQVVFDGDECIWPGVI